MMKTVSLVQVGFQTGPKNLNAYYLPYSVGCLWSYALTSDYIANHYKLEHVIWKREPIQQLAPLLAKSDIVFISCYVWNKNYNYTLAQTIKELNPNAMIVFGGPEPPIKSPTIFKDYPFMDVVVKLEGEKTVKLLLEKFYDMQNVPGLLINNNKNIIDTGPNQRISDLEILPSPYLNGFFDEIIASNPSVKWNATLETNRGCPYRCTFCDWGSLTYQKVKKFDLQRVYAEIDWIVKNCDFIALADANFGIYVERDGKIVDYFLTAQEKYNKSVMWSINWAKNIKQDVIQVVKKLVDNPRSQSWGLTLSVQSMDSNVLDIIKRKNMHAENIRLIYSLSEQQKIPVYTEFIFGLPGETTESWKENFYTLFRQDIHSFVEVHLNQLLENAEMNLIQRQDYDIKTTKVYDFISGPYNNDSWPEYIDMVTSTSSMTRNEMVQSYIFTWFIKTFHMFGITNWISRFLFKHLNVDYKDFYDGLLDFISQDKWFIEQQNLIEQTYKKWSTHGKIENIYVDGVEIHGWNLFYATAMQLQSQDKHEYIFSLIDSYLERFNLDQELHQDLITFQSNYLIKLKHIDQYPIQKKIHYNFYDFLVHDEDFAKKLHHVEYNFSWPRHENFQTMLERVFFQRRANYSKATIRTLN